MWRVEKRLLSPGGERRVDILVSDDGLVRFDEYRWYGPWEEDGVALDEGGWMPGPMSGYYASVTEAERAARTEVVWLRDSRNAK